MDNNEPESSVELLVAIQTCDTAAVQNILEKYTRPNLVNKKYTSTGLSSLHVACSLDDDIAFSMVKLLLDYGANPNSTDRIGRTPLYIAVEHENYQVAKLLITKNVNVNAEILPVEEVNSNRRHTSRFYTFENLETYQVYENSGRTPLHQAVRNTDKYTVELLLKNGANVNSIDFHGMTPILLAGANIKYKLIEDYEAIIYLLIKYKANVDACDIYTGATALHNAVHMRSLNATRELLQVGARIKGAKCGQTPLHDAARNGSVEILSLLIEYGKIFPQYGKSHVNIPDDGGKTPLHAAAFAGSRECIKLLVQNGGDLSLKTKLKITVIDAIFKNVLRPVHLLREILDKGIKCNTSNYNSIDFILTFDFTVFAPFGGIKQMSIISAIIEAGKNCQISEIMQHPLTETYLRLKWDRLRIFFTLYVVTFIIYVLSLSSYSLILINSIKYSSSTINNDNIFSLLPRTIYFITEVFRYITMFSSLILIFNTAIESVLVRPNYTFRYEMWLNFLCSILSFIVAFYGSREQSMWRLHVMSITILLAWIELMMLIGRFPTFGYYALMFSAVLQNVIKVLLTFICLIIGFTLSFCIQFHQEDLFDNPWKAFVKTVVMMMSEYDYKDMFSTNDNNDIIKKLPVTSQIIFLFFIIIASIVLMNLMVGLAVDDIQKLKREGQVQRLVKQAVFVSKLETVSNMIFNWKCISTCIKGYFHKRSIAPRIIQFRPGLHGDDLKKIITFDIVESAVKIALDRKTEEIDDKKILTQILSILTELQKKI